jgi:hypothetical protein
MHSPVISADAFDLDGDPLTFNNDEQTVIYNVWERVIAAYEIFDVDITTEYMNNNEDFLVRSSMADEYYGIRAIIGANLGNQLQDYPHAWGWAVTNALFSVGYGSYYNSVCIMGDLMNWNWENIAKCIQHEFGHTAGLSHDGTSQSAYYMGHSDSDGSHGWGPVMGNPYHSLSQFSKGEYFDANQLQDDFEIMDKSIGYETDEFVNECANAELIVKKNILIDEVVIQDTARLLVINGSINFPYDIDCFIIQFYEGNTSVMSLARTINSQLFLKTKIYFDTETVETRNDQNDLIIERNNNGNGCVCISGASYGNPFANPATGWTAYGSVGMYTIQILQSGSVTSNSSKDTGLSSKQISTIITSDSTNNLHVDYSFFIIVISVCVVVIVILTVGFTVFPFTPKKVIPIRFTRYTDGQGMSVRMSKSMVC